MRAGLIYTPYINKKALPLIKVIIHLYVKNQPKGVSLFSHDAAQGEYDTAIKKCFFCQQ